MRDARELENQPPSRFPVIIVWSMTLNDDGGTHVSWAVTPLPGMPSEEQFAALEARGLDAYVMMLSREEFQWLTAKTEKH